MKRSVLLWVTSLISIFLLTSQNFAVDLTDIAQITSVAWSPHKSDQIAFGTCDGSIFIMEYNSEKGEWNLKTSFEVSSDAICSIAFNLHNSHLLAIASGTEIS